MSGLSHTNALHHSHSHNKASPLKLSETTTRPASGLKAEDDENDDKKLHHSGAAGSLGLFLSSFLGPVSISVRNNNSNKNHHHRLNSCRLYTTEKNKRRLRSALFIAAAFLLATSLLVPSSSSVRNHPPSQQEQPPQSADNINSGGDGRDRRLLDEALTTCKKQLNQAKAKASAAVVVDEKKSPPSPPVETTTTTTMSSSNSKNAIQMATFEEDALALTILPNELPGYTGWARPVQTLVDYFRVTGFSAPHATVGQNWSVHLECRNHQACQEGGSLFYIRAYGRSLLPGRVVDHENGTYTVTIFPHDAGRYTLEVVLTCSQRPDWTKLPAPGMPGEPSYEGYLVPGFPLQLTVIEAPPKEAAAAVKDKGKATILEHGKAAAALVELRRLQASQQLPEKRPPPKQPPPPPPQQGQVKSVVSLSSSSSSRPLCSAKQLIETSVDSAVETGRWLVVNKTRGLSFTPRKEIKSYINTEQITLETYMTGHTSVGFQMDYFPVDCDLISLEELAKPETWLNIIDTRPRFHVRVIHILYIGDSNTRNQYNFFRDHIAVPTKYLNGKMRLTYVDMMGHWPETFPKTKAKIEEIMSTYKDDIFFDVFNVGLHEVTNRCTQQGIRKGLKIEGLCHEMYQKDVRELLDLVQHGMTKSSMLHVWQSSTAGWPKWGVHGIAWPQNAGQKVPKEPNFCAYMNELAWDIISEAKIPVMDTFWLTVSRADHREVVKNDNIRTSYKLVHLGPEVYSVLVRKFSMMILEALAKGTLGERYL